MNVRAPRIALFVALALSVTALPFLASADPTPPATSHRAAKRGRGKAHAAVDGAAPEAHTTALAAAGDGGAGRAVSETTAADGGAKTFRFGELEIEGRLKSPQIVYFLRRVRAEFAAGDLGHRSFTKELSQTRHEPEL